MDEVNIKIYIDDSVSNSTVAIGILARNYKEEIIVIQMFRGPCDNSIEGAEAMFKALELIATDKRWPYIIFEGDSMNVISAFKGDFDSIIT
ncbi:hypothetical protein PanWU01x14_119140 [Parasponia andersonii]|uniref:Uncharacterized protein n=1 Tax=Parasponia andersonii TaxID=3476 RepID=A0A2P5CVZ8_PARAD|nr:hypothetical protein PanWU01x14_119140 [Parasponia andersonii]